MDNFLYVLARDLYSLYKTIPNRPFPVQRQEITVVLGVTREPVKMAKAGDIVSISVQGFMPKWTQTLVSHAKAGKGAGKGARKGAVDGGWVAWLWGVGLG